MRKNLGKNSRGIILSFLGCLTTAAIFYGGGNYINKQTPYYNFFTNFISDLGRTTSHSGDDNTISLSFFIIGMLIQVFGAFYFLYKRPKKRYLLPFIMLNSCIRIYSIS